MLPGERKLTLEEKIEKFPTIVYARCCGWLSPVRNYNLGLKAQYKDRKMYNINKTS